MPKTKRKHIRGTKLPYGPHGGVQLLLIHNVDHLGKQGEVVEVRPGYARNYLLPQGLATIATDHHRRMVEKHKAKLLEIERARLATLQSKADNLSQESITIEANATDEGHLYGSVGAPEIVAALKAKEIEITQDQVRLTGPLKEVGLYTVKIAFGQGVEANLKVWVVPLTGGDEEAAS
ncbi:50S ribosomal protein L9 [Planctomycetales bacterium 10988]|nr:50S ribosomal protein L9 [Planctomycetales bacterium 10988]